MMKKLLMNLILIVGLMSASTMAANFTTQSLGAANAPASCIDGWNIVYNNYRYYKGATFYPYDVMYGDTAYRWAITTTQGSSVGIYNPFNSFVINGANGWFPLTSNSKPLWIGAVVATQNIAGTNVSWPNPTSATTRAMQIAYNIARRAITNGANPAIAWEYYPFVGNAIWSYTAWTISNRQFYGTWQNGLECANYYVSRCGDGIVDNGGAVPGAVTKTDAYGYNIWNGTQNTINAGEQCDLGALNGTPGALCNASCQAIPAPVYPDMTLTKSVVGATTGYASGATVTFTLLYKNIGSGDANGVVVTDTLPAGLTYISSSPTHTTVVGQTITWVIPGTLVPNQQGVITVTAKVNAAGVCTTLNNLGSVSAANEQNNTLGNNSSQASVSTLCPNPDVWTVKSNIALEGTFMPGKKVRYTVNYGNQGQGVATGVVLTDTLPAGVTYVPGSAISAPAIGQPTVAGQTLTWNVGTIQPGANGSVSIDVIINVNTPTCTNLTLVNFANISASGEPVGVLANNPSSSSFVMQCIDLWSLKSVDKPTVQSGDTVTYTITYGNLGNIPATGNVVDTLPAGMTFVAGSATSAPNLGQPTVVGQTLTWNAGTMPAGFQGVITFQAKIIAMSNGQQYVNNVCIDGDNNYNNNNCDTATSAGFMNFDLSINKTPKLKSVTLNEQFTYTLTVANNGQVGVSGFSVKDYLPAGLEYISASPAATYNAATKTITWNGLNIGAVDSFQLSVLVKYVGPIANGMETNWAEICTYNGVSANPGVSHDVDSNPCNGTGNNEDDVSSGSIIPTQPGASGYLDLSINKTPKTQVAYSGQTITFNLAVRNDGTAAANNVSVNDYLPAGLQYVSASPAATYNAGTRTITWNGINLPANGGSTNLTVTATYVGTTAVTNWTEVCNYTGLSQSGGLNPWDIDSNPCNGTGNNEDDTSSGSVTPLYIDLNINKLANGVKDLQANAGDTINFILTVWNSGNTTATDFNVKDYLPIGFTFVQADNGGTYNGINRQITRTGLTLAAGQLKTVSFSAIYTDTVARRNDAEVCHYLGDSATDLPSNAVGPRDIDSNPCDNGANIDSSEDDDSSATVRPRTDKFDLSINKLINGVKQLTYIADGNPATVLVTLQVYNSWTVGVSNFSVKDYMPVGLNYVDGSSNQLAANVSYNSGTRQLTFSNLNIAAQGTFNITFSAVYTKINPVINYTEICAYNGVNYTGNDAKDIDSIACNRGANAPLEDDESSALIALIPDEGGTPFDLSINKLINGIKSVWPLNSGTTVAVTLRVTNSGGAVGFNVKDYMPVGLEYIAGSSNQPAANVSYNATSRELVFNNLYFSWSGTFDITFNAVYTTTVTTTNYTEICGYPNGPLGGQDVDSDPCNGTGNTEDDRSSAIINPPNGQGWNTFDVRINKLVNGLKTYAANNGETVTFTLEVANDGNTTQDNVSVRDVLPIGINFVAGTAQPSTAPVSVSYDASGRVLTWSGLTLPNNAKINLTFQATYTDTVSRTNQVEVCSYRGKNQSQPAGAVAQDPDSAPCNGFISEDDDSSATITPKTGGGGWGGGTTNRCGDGIIARPNTYGQYEECDDGDSPTTGNGTAASTCSTSCKTTATVVNCGNGILEAGEACDYKASNVSSTGVILSGPYKGKVCTSSCQIKGINQPQCDYIDPPSVQEGEYLPLRWDLERNFASVATVNDCSIDGQIIRTSLDCEFSVTDAKGDSVAQFVKKCNVNVTDSLITHAYSSFMTNMGYNPGDTSLKYGLSYWKVPVGGNLGEYKVAMAVKDYKICVKNVSSGVVTWSASNFIYNNSSTKRVCEMNFAVTQPYMVNRGAFGDFATDNLKSFYQMPYGTQVFPQGVSLIDNKLSATQEVKDSVKKLVDSYKKLAVAAGDMKLNAQVGATKTSTVKISKVPNKEIYIFEADNDNATITITDKPGVNLAKSFTLIITRGNLIVADNVSARSMYIVTNGKITIKPTISCNTTQTIKGIYVSTANGIESATPFGNARSTMLNTNLAYTERCAGGDLTVQGVLIGDGLSNMYTVRRSNANEWFNAQVSRKEDILNHAAVVIKYNPDIFDHLPPGAEVLSEALSVYKK